MFVGYEHQPNSLLNHRACTILVSKWFGGVANKSEVNRTCDLCLNQGPKQQTSGVPMACLPSAVQLLSYLAQS